MKDYRLDIHNMTEQDAYCAMIEFLNSLPHNVRKMTVIHGYHGGTVLKNMVRNFYHHRIDYISQPLYNQGESIVYLKQ